jgi:aspartate/methionine/tyrosine aminotransferase
MTTNKSRTARRTWGFTESVIREMTRLCNQHDGVNLAQGFPDFPCPDRLKQAACEAVNDDINQYAITWGAQPLRRALGHKMKLKYGLDYDPETEMTVTCGSTEAMITTFLALVDPGEEVIVFEPFYENYGPDAILSGATPRFVPLHEPDWKLDPDELAAAFNDKTRAVIVNSPHNPTGKVFSREELGWIARLCQEYDVLCFTDEIYEHITYDGAQHIPMAGIEGMRDRTVTISGLSKTYAVTGWRVGWCLAPEDLTVALRKVHDFLTVGAPAPLQSSAAVALGFEDAYYRDLAAAYRARRERLLPALEEAGFRTFSLQGAYYVMTDISGFGFPDDVSFARALVEEAGVAAVPGSSFYHRPADGRQRLRFHFARRLETLDDAGRRLGRFRARTTEG